MYASSIFILNYLSIGCITINLRHHHGVHLLIKASYTTSLYTNMAAVYRNLILQAPKNMPHPPVLSVGRFLQSSTWPHESATGPPQWAPCLIKVEIWKQANEFQ